MSNFIKRIDAYFNVNLKIISVIFIIFSLTIGVLLYQVIEQNKQDLISEAYSKIELSRDIKKQELKDYFSSIQDEIEILAKSENTINLTKDLIKVHNELKVQENEPYPVNEKKAIAEIKKHEEYFTSYVQKRHFSDIFVICRKHGHIMYTQAKRSDSGKNLRHSDLKESTLAQLWAKVVRTKQTAFIDMALYSPANHKPMMFVATPVYLDGKFSSVVVFQLSDETINHIMDGRSGMGNSGESLLVGQDYLMRSDSHLDKKHHSIQNSFSNPALGRCNTDDIKNALQNKTNKNILLDYRDQEVLSAYTSIKIDDFKWALITKIDKKEIMQKIDNIVSKIVIEAIVILVLSLILMYFIVSITIKINVNTPIKKAIDSLSTSTSEIESASHDLSGGALSLSDMSARQSASVEQILATVEHTLENTNLNYNNMKELINFGHEMEANTKIGYQNMEKLKNSMNTLSDSSTQVNNLVNTIDEIAFQTNLLALNAAVEAARAGEHGLGFAVVSEEVRNLATRSSGESVKIREVIQSNIDYTNEGISLSEKTNESFEIIMKNIESSAKVRQETTISSKEQKNAIEQLKIAMMEVDSVAQSLSSSSEQISALSEQLSAQASNTNEVVTDIGRMV
jgi:methyl-accepting chemotaxis protein